MVPNNLGPFFTDDALSKTSDVLAKLPQAFPSELEIKVLAATHADYNEDRFKDSEALYEGGDKFDALKNKFLYVKEIERDGDTGSPCSTKGKALREARLQHACYSNPVAPVIDYMAAAAFQSPPQVIFNEKGKKLKPARDLDLGEANSTPTVIPEASDELKYYHDLNRTLPDLLMSRFIEIIMYGSSSIGVCFPSNASTNRTEQAETKGLDAVLYGINPKEVTDWECDADGKLLMMKTYCMDLRRSQPWVPVDIETHFWTFYTPDEIIEYCAEKPVKQKTWGDQKGKMISRQPNKFAILPIFEVYLSKKKCLLNRIRNLVISHFNAEADLNFALNCNAHPQLWFKLNVNRKPMDIVKSPITAWMLQIGEECGYAQSTAGFEALEKAIARKERSIQDRLHSAALDIANRDQGGRASASAKRRDFGPINVLLELYAAQLKKVLVTVLEYIIKVRGDEDKIEFKIIGMDRFDTQSLEHKLDLAEKYYKLPASETAKRFVASEIDQAMTKNASPEVRALVDEEDQALVVGTPEGEESDLDESDRDRDPDEDDAEDDK